MLGGDVAGLGTMIEGKRRKCGCPVCMARVGGVELDDDVSARVASGVEKRLDVMEGGVVGVRVLPILR